MLVSKNKQGFQNPVPVRPFLLKNKKLGAVFNYPTYKDICRPEFERWSATKPFLQSRTPTANIRPRIQLSHTRPGKRAYKFFSRTVNRNTFISSHTQALPTRQALKRVFKTRLNYSDKIIRFYRLQHQVVQYVYKAYLLIELQINAVLVRYKIVPFLFLTHDLCYYGLVSVNNKVRSNPYSLISIFDQISIPFAIYQLMYSRQYLLLKAPWLLLKFLRVYWGYLTLFLQNKMWLLTNAITSPSLATVLLYELPNVYLYLAPFQQFTRLYYKIGVFQSSRRNRSADVRLHRAFKLRLFEYSIFFN